MIRVSVASPQDAVPIDRGFMRQVARGVLEGEGISDAQVSVAFVDEVTSRTLNNRYLKHDEPTDVLSFPLSEGAEKLNGELVICAAVAKAQSEMRGHNVQAELALYVIHGLLHLCGYNDDSADADSEMRHRERHYLKQWNLPEIAPDE
jgi:probable rRNA maturation factor